MTCITRGITIPEMETANYSESIDAIYPAFIVNDTASIGTTLVPQILIQKNARETVAVSARRVFSLIEENEKLKDALREVKEHRERLQKIVSDMTAIIVREACR